MQKTLEDRARSLCCSWCRAGSPCRTGERPRIERILQELVRECAEVALYDDYADASRAAILEHFGLEQEDGL